MLSTGNATVDAIGAINITGNVIPQSWYKTIKKETGKPYLNAIVILADIVYWYRPTEQRDESTGQTVSLKKKFKSDMLQRSYAQIADQFGITKRDATNAIVAIEKLGVVKRHFRKLEVGGMTLNNVLFLELVPSALQALTFPAETGTAATSDTYHPNKGQGTLKLETPSTQTVDTNTKTTQETTPEISTEKKRGKAKAFIPPTREEVAEYIHEMNYGLDPDEFMDKNEMRGWILNTGKPMKDWKAAVRIFERNRKKWQKADSVQTPIMQHTDEEEATPWAFQL